MSAAILTFAVSFAPDNANETTKGVPGVGTNFSRRQHHSVTATEARDKIRKELAVIVNEAIAYHRHRGAKVVAAIELAASDIGISVRRARKWRYDEVDTVSAEEADIIRSARTRLAAQRARYFEERARAELAALQTLETECATQFAASGARP